VPDRSTAAASFDTRELAENAITELKHAGFPEDVIGILDRASDMPGVDDGAFAGAAGGATLGLLGGLALLAQLTPLGPLVAGGTLATLLAGGAIGAAAGGLAGALVALGLSEGEARLYEADLAAGCTLVTVRAGDRHDEALTILRRCGGRGPTREAPAEPLALLCF
jgi:hypothetical protein